MIMRRAHGSLVLYGFPQLEAAGARHAVATRLGGASTGPFASLNLGYSVGDAAGVVEANRRAFFGALRLQPDDVVTCHQVHSTAAARVSLSDRGRGAATPAGAIPATDALITDTPDLFLFLRFADCVPILLCDPVRGVVALAHAGWKGTVGNIVGATVAVLAEAYGSRAQDVMAAVGPCIGPCHYVVQEDVAQQVRAALPFWPSVLRRQDPQGMVLDLPEANRRQLVEAGLAPANVFMAGMCTACHTDEFYSHRAERGQTGRFGVLIGWTPDGCGHG